MNEKIDVFLCYRNSMAFMPKLLKRYIKKNDLECTVWFSDDEIVGNYKNDISRLIGEANNAVIFIDQDFTRGFSETDGQNDHKECITAREIIEIIKKKDRHPDFVIITVFLDREKGFSEEECQIIQKLLENDGEEKAKVKTALLTHNNHWTFNTAKDEEDDLFCKIMENVCLDSQGGDPENTGFQKAYKYAVLSKDSLFSQTIVAAIKDSFAHQAGFSLEPVFFTTESNHIAIAGNHKIVQWLDTNRDEYDGFIIRPFVKITSDLFEAIKRCSDSKKRIILFDTDFSPEQLEDFDQGAVPLYVCSDQERGGELLANEINKIVGLLGKSNTSILLCDASRYTVAIKERTEIIKRNLQEYGLFDIVGGVLELSDLNPQKSSEAIKNFFYEKFSNLDKGINNILINAGNDNVALEFTRILRTDQKIRKIVHDKKIILIGYDGVKQPHSEKSILDSTIFDYITVDVLPYEQGKAIADLCFEQGDVKDRIVKAEPSIDSRYSIPGRITNDFKEIGRFALLKKGIIFDFDGTLANTEEYHWKAYDELLKNEYNIRISEDDISRYIGNSEKEIYKMIEEDYSIRISEESFLERRLEIYIDLVESDDLEPYEWVRSFLHDAEEKNISCFILSSQVPEIIDILLKKWGIKKYFPDDHIICTHDGKVQKKEVIEAPEKYFKGVKKEDICLIEDSDKVLELAGKNGIDCYGIIHKYNKNKLGHCLLAYDKKRANGLFIGLCGLDIVFFGDRLPDENGKVKAKSFLTQVGGPAAKAAITCSKLGGKATLITGIGNSSIAENLKKELDEQGVSLIDIGGEAFREPNISAVFVNSEKGSRTIISGQNQVDSFSSAKIITDDYDYCLYDCNFPDITDEISSIVDYHNIPMVLDCGSWKDNIECALTVSDIAISSGRFVSPEGEDIFSLGKTYSIPLVAKTKEGDPVEYRDKNDSGNIEVAKSEKGNTLGAGDVFHGAFCYYYFNEGNTFKAALEKASQVATNYVKTGIIEGE